MIRKNYIVKRINMHALSERDYPKLESLALMLPKIKSLFTSELNSDELMASIAKELKNFGKLGVRSVINEVLGDEQLLLAYANKCYLHKNGFYRLNLASHENFAIRFHIWLPGADAMETLHDHRWHIASAIIDGNLKSEIWQDSASGCANLYDEYMYIDKHTDPILIGQSKVEFVKEMVHHEGECYVLNTGIMHRIVSSNENLTSTLICHSANTRKYSRNIIINNRIPNVKPKYLKAEEFQQILKKYLHLSANEN